eukprot:11297558-Alexandrium_andersonii.AAC.1
MIRCPSAPAASPRISESSVSAWRCSIKAACTRSTPSSPLVTTKKRGLTSALGEATLARPA